MIAMKIWKDVFQNIKSNADTYLSSDKIRAKYKNPDTSISFTVDAQDHRINAYIRKTFPNIYEIQILAGLIEALEQQSRVVISTYPTLFKNVDRSDRKKFETAQAYILYLWLDFIFCHEWAHALCGHLDFQAEIQEWYELENEKFSGKGIDEQTCQKLEAEADSYAAKFSLARFSTYWESLSKDIYSHQDGRIALHDYVTAMLSLFHFLEELRANEESPKNTHPIPFNRAFIFLAFCQGEYENIPGLPTLTPRERELLFGIAAVEFYVKGLGIDPDTYFIRSIEAAKFTESVGVAIDSIGLKEFRLSKPDSI